jgi:hypothetical protein
MSERAVGCLYEYTIRHREAQPRYYFVMSYDGIIHAQGEPWYQYQIWDYSRNQQLTYTIKQPIEEIKEWREV